MIFASYIFVFAFLPIVLLLYFGMAKYVSRKFQSVFLILASLVFYGYNHIGYVWILVASVLVNYMVSLHIQNSPKKNIRTIAFYIGVIFNILLLGYYKYYDFFIENINSAFDTTFVLKNILLPLGISFYTFQQIAYLIGVRNGEDKVPGFIDYSMFITFFPQLVAGPIVFFKDVIKQYQDDKNRFFNIDNFSQGLFIFIIGMFKKAVLADTLFIFVSNTVYDTNMLSFGASWLGLLAYTFQLYFDFSGYSDMAIGLGKMMNINLPVNFYSPYKSRSVAEFWRRWHITLGRALTVLIYFPLGGSRKGLARTCMNLFMVFFVCGIWHGASWKFIVWGCVHGLAMVFERLFRTQLDKIPDKVRFIGTFVFITITMVFPCVASMEQAVGMFKAMFGFKGFTFEGISHLAFNTSLAYPDILQIIFVIGLLLISAYITLVYPKNSVDLYNEFKPKVKTAVILSVLFVISVVHFSKVGAFIYFNF